MKLEDQKQKIQSITLWTIVIVFIALFLHSTILALYFYNKNRQWVHISNSKRDYSLIYSIIIASQEMQQNELKILPNLSKYYLIRNKSRIQISVTETPLSTDIVPNHINQTQLRNLLDAMHGDIGFSYRLKGNNWLNYSETPVVSGFMLSAVLLILELAVVLFLIFYALTIYRLKVPLKSITASANRLGLDINSHPLKVYGSSVVKEAIQTMNKMQSRIQELISNRTRLLASISHDLHTPLMRIALRVQFIKDPEISKKITMDVNDMQMMLRETLAFSKNDMLRQKKVKMDFSALINSICDDFIDMGNDVEIDNPYKSIPFYARVVALKRAFTNLIHNGLKYGSKVCVIVNYFENEIKIQIKDNGPGIPENEMKEVFKAFYRGKTSRANKSTGTGLGLTTAQEIINAHDGQISLHNILTGGLMVEVVLHSTIK